MTFSVLCLRNLLRSQSLGFRELFVSLKNLTSVLVNHGRRCSLMLFDIPAGKRNVSKGRARQRNLQRYTPPRYLQGSCPSPVFIWQSTILSGMSHFQSIHVLCRRWRNAWKRAWRKISASRISTASRCKTSWTTAKLNLLQTRCAVDL